MSDKTKNNLGKKNSRAFKVLAGQFLGPIASDYKLTKYEKALEVSVWAFAAIMRLSGALAQIDFRIIDRYTKKSREDEPEAKFIRDILDRVNPDETYFDFVERAFVNLSLYGEVFIEKARVGKRVGYLYHLSPLNMKVIPGTSRYLIDGYVFSQGMNQIKYPREDIIFCKLPNPTSPYRGISPIAAVANSIGADVQAALYNLHLLLNGGRPGGILTPTDGDIDDVTWERLEKRLQNEYGGPKTAGKYLVLPSGFKFERDTESLKDMDFLQLRKFVREEVSAAIGVAPMMVQNFDSATYANSEQQLKAFWDYVAKPHLKRFFGSLNEFWIHPEVDKSLSIEPDFVGIDAMVDSEESRVNNAVRLVQAGLATINEAREKVGLGPIKGGDALLMPLNMVPYTPGATPENNSPEKPPEKPNEPEKPKKKQVSERIALAFRIIHLQDLDKAKPHIRNAVKRWFRGSRDRILNKISQYKDPKEIDVEGLIDQEDEIDKLAQILIPEWTAVLRDSGRKTLARLGFERRGGTWQLKKSAKWEYFAKAAIDEAIFSLENPEIDDILKNYMFKNIKTVVGTEYKQTVATDQQSILDGRGVSEIQQDLHEWFLERTDYWAERIARTEALSAVNMGSHIAYKEAGTPAREWMAIIDDATRPDHIELNGQTVTGDQQYRTVDPDTGEVAFLRFPGDPMAPGWAAINCRCGELPAGAEGIDLTLAYINNAIKELDAERRKEIERYVKAEPSF